MSWFPRKYLLVELVALISVIAASAQEPSAKPPVLNNAAFTVRLTAPLSTKTNQKGEEVTAQVITPPAFQNWFVVGRVDKSMSSGSFNKKSELRFSFQHLANPTGSIKYPVTARVTSFTNSKGVQNADEEGQIVESRNQAGKAALFGALAGAGVGALAGGGKGVGIGAGAGAAAGLLFASFGTKGPSITFDTGSEFHLSVSNASQAQ